LLILIVSNLNINSYNSINVTISKNEDITSFFKHKVYSGRAKGFSPKRYSRILRAKSARSPYLPASQNKNTKAKGLDIFISGGGGELSQAKLALPLA